MKNVPLCLRSRRAKPPTVDLMRRPKHGVVYLLEDANRTGTYKVGRTESLDTRLADINKVRPVRLVWYILTNHTLWLERHVMIHWSDCHEEGEWFRLAPEQVRWFRSFRAVNWKAIESG